MTPAAIPVPESLPAAPGVSNSDSSEPHSAIASLELRESANNGILQSVPRHSRKAVAMASLSTDRNGGRRIQFFDRADNRKAIRLGRIAIRAAESVRGYVDRLESALRTGAPIDAETLRWLANIGGDLHGKLARAGLCEPRTAAAVGPTLQEMLDEYIGGRTDLKEITRCRLSDSRRKLLAFFGAKKPVADVTPADADAFRRHLLALGLGDNTIRRQCGRAKQFFRWAVRKRIVAESPFADMKATNVQPNRSRDRFVSRDAANRVLEACPDAQWRLLFALARFAGLRVPSEPLSLHWSDVDWERNRFRIKSPKLEYRGDDKAVRWIPIFPEVKPHLEAVWEAAEPGAEFVITRYRDTNANLRTQLLRIIGKARVDPWPKLFVNLRASFATELQQRFPIHVCCEWLGHSALISQRHYLQVTDADFDKAAAPESAAQNPAQQPSKTVVLNRQAVNTADSQPQPTMTIANSCSVLHKRSTPLRGFEPLFSP